MLLNCGVGEDSWESLGLQGDPTSPSWRKSVLSIHWKDWCWTWNSNPLATWCEELTRLKRPWCWERLKVGGEGDKRGRWLDCITDSMHMSLSQLWEGHWGLMCCSPWGRKELDISEQQNWTDMTVIHSCRIGCHLSLAPLFCHTNTLEVEKYWIFNILFHVNTVYRLSFWIWLRYTTKLHLFPMTLYA